MASPVAFRTRRRNSAVNLTTLAAAKNQSTCGLRLAVRPEAEYSWIPMMHSRLALLGWLSLLSLVSGAGIRAADAIEADGNRPRPVPSAPATQPGRGMSTGQVARELIRRILFTTFVIAPEDAKPHTAFEDADLVAVNVYQGSLAGKLAHHLGELDERVTGPSEEFIRRQLAALPDKPLLITEFGARGVPGIHGDVVYSEDFQAACIQAAWKAIQNCEEASGGVLWSWADYYHRRTLVQYAVFGPYGVVTVDRRPKAALTALTRMYKGEQTR